jgi:cell division septation protein DedD
MVTQPETVEDEYEEYDEFDEGEGERGLSGLVVLLMGVVMLGAFASIVWIAFQQGVKSVERERGSAPYIAADQEPVKIENETAQAAKGADRAVYGKLEGAPPNDVEILAQAPEEPVARTAEDPIAAIASGGTQGASVTDDAAGDRIAALDAADASLHTAPNVRPTTEQPAARQATAPMPAATTPAPEPSVKPPAAASGGHLVQVGAFKSQEEADGFWTRLQARLGDYVGGKSPDIERADLEAKGVYYRLRLGPFESAADAKNFCEGLKSRGQDCLVRKK